MSSKEELQAQIESIRQRQQQLLANYNNVLSDMNSDHTNITPTITTTYPPNTPIPQMPQTIPILQSYTPPPPPPSKDSKKFFSFFGKDKKVKETVAPVLPNDTNVTMNVAPASLYPPAGLAWPPANTINHFPHDLKPNPTTMNPSLPPSYDFKANMTSTSYAPLHDLKPDALNMTPQVVPSLPPPYDSRKTKQQYQDEITKAAMSNNTIKKKFDLIFLVDCTGSMTNLIGAVMMKLSEILNLEQSFPNVTFEVAFVGYRDINYGNYIIHGFSEADILRPKLLNISVVRNCDEAEDVLGGYEQVLKLLNGRPLRNRCLIHFFDAPPHGKRFHNEQTESYDRFWNYEPPYPHKPSTWLEECVTELCRNKVYCSMISLLKGYNEAALEKTVDEFRKAFYSVAHRRGEKMFNAHSIDFYKVDPAKDANLSDFVEIVRKALEDSLSSMGLRPQKPPASI